MDKNYLSKIIAKDYAGLQVISAYCSGSKVDISNIKYLSKNSIFLISLERPINEKDKVKKNINSICKFEFVDSVKSKNVNQGDPNLKLELLAIDFLKNKESYEINLIFSNNAYIVLSTEVIEVILEDQKIN
jgi:hypothetical protein